MASDTANVKLGVCTVTFNNVDLGYTQGGVEVSVSTETHKVLVDQFGKTPINELVMGREIKVKVPLAETTLENLVSIMPGATLVTETGPPLKKCVKVNSGIGTNLLTTAHKLVLRPIGTTGAEDITIPHAATAGAMNFAYKLENERIFNCEFMGYPDSTTGDLFYFGDEGALTP